MEPTTAEPTDPVGAAAADITKPAETKKKRTRETGKATAKAETPQVVEVTFHGISAKDVAGTVDGLLKALATRTKTERPSPDEVDAISSGIAVGLKNTKFAIDPATGPWIPLGLALTAYALPRIMDVVMRAQKAKESANSGPFRAVEVAPVPAISDPSDR